jgi:hypothetical protein
MKDIIEKWKSQETMPVFMDNLDGLTNKQLLRLIMDHCYTKRKDRLEKKIIHAIQGWERQGKDQEVDVHQAKKIKLSQ